MLGAPVEELLGRAGVEESIGTGRDGMQDREAVLGTDREFEQGDQIRRCDDVSAIHSAPLAQLASTLWNAPMRTAAADIGPRCAHQNASASTKHFVTPYRSAGATGPSGATGRVAPADTACTDDATIRRRQPARKRR